MFSTAEFQAWGKDNAILFASVMTKIENRPDDELLRTYGFRGFPSLAVLDADGTKITDKIGRDLVSISAVVKWAGSYQELKDSDDADPGKLFMARLAMGELSYDEAAEERKSLEVSGEMAKEIDQHLFGMKMDQLMRSSSGRGATVPKDEAAAQVYKAYKAGDRLKRRAAAENFFDSMLVHAAVENGDARAFFFAYDRVLAAQKAALKAWEDSLESYNASLEQAAGNKQMEDRYRGAIERAKQSIESTNEAIAKLQQQADEMKQKLERG